MALSPAAQAEADELTAHHNDEEIPVSALDGARLAWPKDKNYWFWFLVLGLITLAEVSTYTHADVWGSFVNPSLLFMMAVKFWIVTYVFMHLRNDSRLLAYVFYSGLVLAVAVYCATLAVFRFF